MLKSIALAAALSLTTMTGALAGNKQIEFCEALGDIAEGVAELRDNGYSVRETMDILISAGVEPEAALSLVRVAYLTLGEDDPVHVGNVVALTCIKGLA